MNKNQDINKPFKIPQACNKIQADLQQKSKPTLNDQSLKDFDISDTKKVNQQLPQRQSLPNDNSKQKNIKKPQSKEVDFEVKQEYNSIIVDENSQSSEQEEVDAVTQNSEVESQYPSQDSDCEDAEVQYQNKKAVIRDHILERRQNEYKIKQEKLFKCKFCPKQYSQQKNLNDHISEIHSLLIQDSFLCLYCAKGYKTPEGRDNHEKNLCPNRANVGQKRKSPYQLQIDDQYEWIMKQKAKDNKKK